MLSVECECECWLECRGVECDSSIPGLEEKWLLEGRPTNLVHLVGVVQCSANLQQVFNVRQVAVQLLIQRLAGGLGGCC